MTEEQNPLRRKGGGVVSIRLTHEQVQEAVTVEAEQYETTALKLGLAGYL